MLALGSALVALAVVVGGLTISALIRSDERARAARLPRAVFVAQLKVSPRPEAREYARVLERAAPCPGETFVDLEARFREYLISTTGTVPFAMPPRYRPIRH